jgi:hypothetical protein
MEIFDTSYTVGPKLLIGLISCWLVWHKKESDLTTVVTAGDDTVVTNQVFRKNFREMKLTLMLTFTPIFIEPILALTKQRKISLCKS